MSIKCEGSEESVELHGGRWSIQRPLARSKQSYTLFEGRHSPFSAVPLLCAAKLVMFSVRSTPEGSQHGDCTDLAFKVLSFPVLRCARSLSHRNVRERCRNASRRLRHRCLTISLTTGPECAQLNHDTTRRASPLLRALLKGHIDGVIERHYGESLWCECRGTWQGIRGKRKLHV